MTQKQFYEESDRNLSVQVGSLETARPGDRAGQEHGLLAEGQAVSGQRHLDDGAAGRHPRAAAEGRPGPDGRVPAYSSIRNCRITPGVVMHPVPSTRTDYMPMNEKVKPFDDVHVRRAISYTLDRQADHRLGALRQRQTGQLVHALAGALLRRQLAGHAVRHEPGQGGDGAVLRAERVLVRADGRLGCDPEERIARSCRTR